MSKPMDFDHKCNESYCPECRAAATRTYKRLQALGMDEATAFRAALKVLALRHPNRSPRDHMAALLNWFDKAH